MKKIAYLLIFFVITPLTLAISSISLISLSTQMPQPQVLSSQTLFEAPQFGIQVYAALPAEQPLISTSATASDARVEIVRQYLTKYYSPLEPFANLIVAVSDQYGLDYRLLVAIAQQESNLCKKAPSGSFNCWGWGIHSAGTLNFPDYATAISEVGRGIREDYVDKGYDTVERMMVKYTPLSDGSWAIGVNQFLAEME